MDVAEFVRSHYLRAPGIMWLFGAGTSASAGVPTADQMVWEFKRVLYATMKGEPAPSLNLGDPHDRQKIQDHFDQVGGFAAQDSDVEYASYFERAWPHPQDRRAYIQRVIEGAEPTFGHWCVGVLLAMKKIQVVWSTNFDRLVEDASVQVSGTTTTLNVATLDSTAVATRALAEGQALYGKIHGDYQSELIKNTSTELQEQDRLLRGSLISAAASRGLAVVGFSGRDESVMEALLAALDQPDPFPHGLFWFHRYGESVRAQVQELFDRAKAKSVEAHLIGCGSFDELFGHVILPFDIPAELQRHLDRYKKRQWKSPFELPQRGNGWPVLRLNGLLVSEFPRVCRRIECEIGGTKDVRAAIENSGVSALAARRRDGVIGFGADKTLRQAFGPFGIAKFDIGHIDISALARRSSDLGLLYDALAGALAGGTGLRSERIHREHALVVDSTSAAPNLDALRQAVGGSVSGIVPRTKLVWSEGVRMRLEWHFENLWLIAEPFVWVQRDDDLKLREPRRDFIKARTDRRYNKTADAIFKSWLEILASKPHSLFGLAPSEGIDATFELADKNAFTRRGKI